MTADVEVDNKIGQSLCSAEKLMTELNLFKDKTKVFLSILISTIRYHFKKLYIFHYHFLDYFTLL